MHAPAGSIAQPQAQARRRFIYVAGPNTPMGGGMWKVAQYLVDAQPQGEPVLRMLETRGPGRALLSPLYLARAIGAIARGRWRKELAGVHVNVAERLSLVRKGVLMGACRLLGVPVVLHLHAAQLPQTYARLPGVGKLLVRWMFSLPQSCVVLGRTAADFVAGELRVPADRIEVVINGVPSPAVPRRTGERAVPHVVFLGNLSERKGVPDLLQALTHPALAHRRLRVSLAGGGDVEAFRTMATELGVQDRVEFLGWAGPELVGKLLADADVMVLPSHDEGLPLAILESLAHGVAVVCTPVGEIPNVLLNGRHAWFVEPGNPASIARGLAQVLGEPSMRERLEREGRALYDAEFSLPRFASAIARVHERHFGLSAAPRP
ncbi:glycosyltransferase family 4 protein [Ramlibacter sp. CrO1]|uniref:Glycosyltransferase family 4 protein n=2 Tax=Ramlibacter algicola TaxID=2795217 RepID=A0A934Q0Z6_9BURK|nr:glycosyltransferase family 4 protein [Ramlibacter algicola]